MRAAPLRAATVGLFAAAALLVDAGRFDAYRTCADCIEAGFGWSPSKSKCGGYRNKQCPPGTAAAPAAALSQTDEVDEADEEAAALEAARVEIDRANMEEAIKRDFHQRHGKAQHMQEKEEESKKKVRRGGGGSVKMKLKIKSKI